MTIAEVSKKYDMSSDTLRYYERIGLIPEVNRTESGIRNYSEEDCKWVEFAKCMRASGISIEVLIEYVKLVLKGDSTIATRKKLLMEQRDQLQQRMEEMQKTLNRLNTKIDNYDSIFNEKTKNLKVSKRKY